MDHRPERRRPRPHGRRAARGPARPTPLLHRLDAWAASAGAATLVVAVLGLAAVLLGLVGAVFTAASPSPAATLATATLDTWLPTAVTATRTTATTCQVTWTPAAGGPASLRYDVMDGASTLLTGQSGTSASITVQTASATPAVRVRTGSWLSAAATTAAAPCHGFPDAPGSLTLTPTTGQVAAAWAAPSGNGGTVTSYTATISPAPGSGSATCTVAAPATACTFPALTDGLTYTVAVTATSSVGTGPAATASAVPYPSTIMTGASTALWLDGADAGTVLAAPDCSAGAATGTVACWKDKSGNGRHASQTTTTRRPATTTVAGRTVPRFDGSDDGLTLDGSGLPSGTADSTALVVGSLTDPLTHPWGYATALSWGTATTGQMRQVLQEGTTRAVRADTHNGAAPGVQAGSWSPSEPTVTVAQWLSGTSVRLDVAGGTTATTTGTFGTVTGQAAVGNKAGSTLDAWSGPVDEVIVLSRAVSEAERRVLEEYLARKWASVISPSAPTGLSGGTATASATSAAMSWTAPAWDGGAAVTGSTVTAVPVGGGTPVTCTAAGAATACTLTGLSGGGTQYSVTVTATNAAGSGPASSATTVFAGAPSSGNVKVWLAADDLDADGAVEGSAEAGVTGGRTSAWKDKSGNGFDTSAPTSGERPVYGARTVNGLSVPTFDGTTVLTTPGANLNPYGITADRSLFVVTRARAWTSADDDTLGNRTYLTMRPVVDNPIFATGVCAGQWGVQHRHDGTANNAACVKAGSTVTANRLDVVEAFRSGTSILTGVSGSPGSSATLASTITQRPLSVGRHSNLTTSTGDVDVAEVLLYDAALSGTAKRAVESYLAAKWGALLAPLAPTGVTAAPGNASAAVSWTPPTDTGSAALTGFTARTTSGATCTAVAPATSCTITGLTNGTTYSVFVTAANSVGSGERSATTTVVPVTVPGAPTGVGATHADTTTQVSWTAPASSGGTPVTGYTVTATPQDAGLPVRTCTSAASPCTVTGLTNGAPYSVTVQATNAAGTGAASAPGTARPYPASIMTSAALQLWLDGADAATVLASSACTAGPATSTVGCWKDKSTKANHVSQPGAGAQPAVTTVRGHAVPSYDGTSDYLSGSPTLLTGGTAALTLVVAGSVDPSVAAGNRSVLAHGGTTNGTQKRLASWGSMTADTLGGAVAQDGGWPGASAQGVVVSTWSGGSSFSLYAGGRPGASAAVANSTGTDHLFVGANRAGAVMEGWWQGTTTEVVALTGVVSPAQRRVVEEYLARKWGSAITPAAVSGASAAAGPGTASVTWTAPAWSGSSAVTSYTVTPSGPGSCTVTGATAACTGLSAGTAYTFAVTATNAVGTGPAVTTASVTTPTVPGAPTGVGATTGDGSSVVSWTAPASDGGSPVTSYTATATSAVSGVSTRTCTSATSPCTLTNLSNGAAYTVTVRATNAVGAGPASSSTALTPAPAAPASATLALWLDGADPSTLYAGSGCSGGLAGSTVGCWRDKAGGRAFVATGGLARASLGGHSVPFLDGTSEWLTGPVAGSVALPTGTATSTVVGVGTLQDNDANDNAFFTWGGTATGTWRGLWMRSDESILSGTGGSHLLSDSSWAPYGTPVVAIAEHTTPSVWLSARGRPRLGVSSSPYSTGTSTAQVGAVGSTDEWEGEIGEVRVYAGTLTAVERRGLEESLAHKWSATITPSAPADVVVTPGAPGTATLTWNAPGWTGGSAVTSWSAAVSGGGTCTVSGMTATCTGIPSGSRTFAVSATNAVGRGPSALVSAQVS